MRKSPRNSPTPCVIALGPSRRVRSPRHPSRMPARSRRSIRTGHQITLADGKIFQVPASWNFSSYKVGDNVRVTYEMQNGHMVASSVVAYELAHRSAPVTRRGQNVRSRAARRRSSLLECPLTELARAPARAQGLARVQARAPGQRRWLRKPWVGSRWPGGWRWGLLAPECRCGRWGPEYHRRRCRQPKAGCESEGDYAWEFKPHWLAPLLGHFLGRQALVYGSRPKTCLGQGIT